jgi:predicted DNA-binding antitoxin AbrB/MazE fold protein
MAAERVIMSGTMHNGVIVPDNEVNLPEGARVDILLPEQPSVLQAEFNAWDLASDEDLAAFEAVLRSGKGE